MTKLKNKNTEIFFKEHLVANPKSNILILHGLAEHSGRYDEFVNILNENNINAFVMDLNGHGRSGGKRGDIESLKKSG